MSQEVTQKCRETFRKAQAGNCWFETAVLSTSADQEIDLKTLLSTYQCKGACTSYYTVHRPAAPFAVVQTQHLLGSAHVSLFSKLHGRFSC